MIIPNKHVVCLYDACGLSARDWAINGYDVYCYDIAHQGLKVENVGLGNIYYAHWDARDQKQNQQIVDWHKNQTVITLCFPPCTDLAVSGAAHFKAKCQANPNFQQDAMHLVYVARDIAQALGAPYCIENPVSVISSHWRKPDHMFHPYEYGGYLPEDDVHPVYPEYIAPRDAYPKKTCYWVGNGFVMPPKKPVVPEPGYSKQHIALGGKSEKTKKIRSISPRGIAKAIYLFNQSNGNTFQTLLSETN